MIKNQKVRTAGGWIVAIWCFLGWTAKVSYRLSPYTPNGFYLSFKQRGRWYSPVFWLWAVAELIRCLLVEGLLQWLGMVWTEATCWTLGSERNGTWKDGVSKRAKRKAIFLMIWGW